MNKSELIENVNYVKCKICNKQFKQLSGHFKVHNITSQEYLKLYPNSILECEDIINKIKITKQGTKEKRSKLAKKQFAEGKRKIPISNGKGLGGKRHDLNNQYFRSMWEANFARVLKYKNIDYIYEVKIPIYDDNKNLLCTYVPDFYLPKYDSYIEIKGKWEDGAKQKTELFKKYFPNKKYVIIESEQYSNIRKIYLPLIIYWETSRSNIKNNSSLFEKQIDSKPKKKLYTCPICKNNYYDMHLHLTLAGKRNEINHIKFKKQQYDLLKKLFSNYDFNKHVNTFDFGIYFTYKVCKRIWGELFSKDEREKRKQILINNSFKKKERNNFLSF